MERPSEDRAVHSPQEDRSVSSPAEQRKARKAARRDQLLTQYVQSTLKAPSGPVKAIHRVPLGWSELDGDCGMDLESHEALEKLTRPRNPESSSEE